MYKYTIYWKQLWCNFVCTMRKGQGNCAQHCNCSFLWCSGSLVQPGKGAVHINCFCPTELPQISPFWVSQMECFKQSYAGCR